MGGVAVVLAAVVHGVSMRGLPACIAVRNVDLVLIVGLQLCSDASAAT